MNIGLLVKLADIYDISSAVGFLKSHLDDEDFATITGLVNVIQEAPPQALSKAIEEIDEAFKEIERIYSHLGEDLSSSLYTVQRELVEAAADRGAYEFDQPDDVDISPDVSNFGEEVSIDLNEDFRGTKQQQRPQTLEERLFQERIRLDELSRIRREDPKLWKQYKIKQQETNRQRRKLLKSLFPMVPKPKPIVVEPTDTYKKPLNIGRLREIKRLKKDLSPMPIQVTRREKAVIEEPTDTYKKPLNPGAAKRRKYRKT